MKIIVDTCIWSLALRRANKGSGPVARTLEQLIQDTRVQMLGPIRQEFLSGIKSTTQFDRISEIIRAFPDSPLQTDDYELAVKFFNRCRGKGIQGSNTDFLICSVAARLKMPIFTVDNDFLHFSEHLPIHLFQEDIS